MSTVNFHQLENKRLCLISKKTLILILELNANYRQKTLETWDNVAKVRL